MCVVVVDGGDVAIMLVVAHSAKLQVNQARLRFTERKEDLTCHTRDFSADNSQLINSCSDLLHIEQRSDPTAWSHNNLGSP